MKMVPRSKPHGAACSVLGMLVLTPMHWVLMKCVLVPRLVPRSQDSVFSVANHFPSAAAAKSGTPETLITSQVTSRSFPVPARPYPRNGHAVSDVEIEPRYGLGGAFARMRGWVDRGALQVESVRLALPLVGVSVPVESRQRAVPACVDGAAISSQHLRDARSSTGNGQRNGGPDVRWSEPPAL